jgi:hypothetical protein
MVGIIQTIIYIYVAFLIVVTLHELGHFPQKIKFRFGIIPSASAMYAKYRIGGLIVNVILFVMVQYYKPENILLQYVGFIAWAHFIIYSILGSIIPEPYESQVDIKTYVFDDVENDYWYFFIGAAILAYYIYYPYYLPILKGVFV